MEENSEEKIKRQDVLIRVFGADGESTHVLILLSFHLQGNPTLFSPSFCLFYFISFYFNFNFFKINTYSENYFLPAEKIWL